MTPTFEEFTAVSMDEGFDEVLVREWEANRMEDRALKFIEANNTAIWLAIAALAVVVVFLKRA